MLRKLEEIAGWLFEKAPEGWYGQLAFGGADKVAKLWLPGRKESINPERLIRASVIAGCTPRAYLFPTAPMAAQECWVCWVGLDIDDVGPEAAPLVRSALGPGWSLRSSNSGNGLHAIARLDKPLFCSTAQSQTVVKRITAPAVERCQADGIEVCKADCRVFWLVGGKQQWIHQSPEWLDIEADPVPKQRPPAAPSMPIPDPGEQIMTTPGVGQWVKRFIEGGIIKSCHAHQVCYLDDALKLLERHAEFCRPTKSKRSGNKQPNAYVDITPDSIQLWSYADGMVLWSYEEPDLGDESEDDGW